MDAYTRIFTLERADEAELFHCMQEAAGEDADRRGGGMDALFAKGLAWVLLWQRLDIVRRPAAGEQLRIVTMPGKGRLGLYPRRFELWSGDERIGAARSVWAIINAETRSMAALSDAPLSGETERQSLRMDSIPAPDGGESFRFAPAAEYIDRNGHMNNAAYLAALAEYLPDYFDMLLLASTSELESAPHDMVTLTYPIRPNDLASTVEMMLTQLDRRLKKRKSQPKKRTEQEQNYINNAKWLLMERNHMTEQEAFRYIQKSSMDSGTNMVETAQMILLLIYDG